MVLEQYRVPHNHFKIKASRNSADLLDSRRLRPNVFLNDLKLSIQANIINKTTEFVDEVDSLNRLEVAVVLNNS